MLRPVRNYNSFDIHSLGLWRNPHGLYQVLPHRMNKIRDGHYTLGIAYLDADQYDEAIEQLEKAISVDADYIEAYHALALAYLQQQRLQDAKDAARQALRIDATYQPILSLIQAIEPSMPTTPQGNDNPTEQPDVIENPVEKEVTPEQPNLTTPPEEEKPQPEADDTDIDKELDRGIVFLANKQYPQAEAAFKKVIKASPNHAIAHYNLAQSYMETGVFTDAKIQVDKALRLNPSYKPAQQLQEGITYLANKERQSKLQKKLIKYLVPIAILIVALFIAYRYGGVKVILPQSKPPIISIDTTLEEPDKKDGYIQAGENVRLKLTISNRGGAAKDLKVRVLPKTMGNLRYNISDNTFNIAKNGFKTMRMPITVDKQAPTKIVRLRIEVLDKYRNYRNPLATTDVHLHIKSK